MNGTTNAQSRTRNRAQRGSGCSFMNAPRIIEASKGNSEPAWLETSRALPCEGTWRTPTPSTLHHLSERNSNMG